jgi:hypothetical protein
LADHYVRRSASAQDVGDVMHTRPCIRTGPLRGLTGCTLKTRANWPGTASYWLTYLPRFKLRRFLIKNSLIRLCDIVALAFRDHDSQIAVTLEL